MTIEDLPQDIQESEQERVSYRAECYKVMEEYQELFQLYDAIDRKHKRIQKAFETCYKDYEENMGDESNQGG